MENGSCRASPECSCNVEWKQSIKLLCVSSAGATVSTRLNSFIYAKIHTYILPLSPKLHCFYAENKPVAVSCPSPVLVVHIDWFPADRGASALFFLVLVVSHSGRDKCEKKNRAIWHQNEKLVHDWCHGCKLWWKLHPLEGGRPMLLISF